MIKVFLTGDNHFGKKYDRYPEIRKLLIESRFDALKDMVNKADEESCDFFVVSGDLFDKISGIKKADIKKVVDILGSFDGRVLVLPGNHDYYTGTEMVWKDFEKALSETDNITVLKEFKEYPFEVGEDQVVVYPAFCQSKHSDTNNLSWIKESEIQKKDVINIGIAHGAIAGLTPDQEGQYFLMTEEELKAIPVDAWLIGHTHVPYPNNLKEDKDTTGYKIFNAGTHEQTDLANHTDGNGFIISIDKNGIKAKVSARKFISGKIQYSDLDIHVEPKTDHSLHDALSKALKNLSTNTVIRVTVSGTAKSDEYQNRSEDYKEQLSRFLTYEVSDNELSEEISREKIRSEYAETSFAAQFLEDLIDDPIELHMAYELLKECKDTKAGK